MIFWKTVSQILHGTYLHKKYVHHLSEIQTWLGVLYVYLLNLTTLTLQADLNASPKTKNIGGASSIVPNPGYLLKLSVVSRTYLLAQ